MAYQPTLDPNSEVSIYRQLFNYFREEIESGRMRKGERLPATRELAGLLHLNRATVAQAYEMLEASGLIESRTGRGSFVASRDGLDWITLLSHGQLPAPPVAARPEAISFAASRPSEKLFPIGAVADCCREALAADGSSILQLGAPGGYEPLRRFLMEHARQEGVADASDDLIVTSGCQQALDLIRRVLLKPGDRVAIEDPVYPGLRNLFLEAGVRVDGIPVGDGGLDLAELERLAGEQRLKMVVVTSNFQNPTGATLSRADRQRLLRIVRAAGAVLVENDIYSALRYSGAAVPAIKQLDTAGDTVLLRSFSKVAFPGLRVGWAIAPQPLIERLAEAKQLADLHTDQLSQAVLLRFVETDRLQVHGQRVLTAGAERLAAVLEGCERHLPPGTRFTRPEGGMNVWVRLPEPLDAGELLPRAQREGVDYVPGRYFAVSRVEHGALRLCFAGLEPERIEEGLRILGRVFNEELDRIRAGRGHETAPAIV